MTRTYSRINVGDKLLIVVTGTDILWTLRDALMPWTLSG